MISLKKICMCICLNLPHNKMWLQSVIVVIITIVVVVVFIFMCEEEWIKFKCFCI